MSRRWHIRCTFSNPDTLAGTCPYGAASRHQAREVQPRATLDICPRFRLEGDHTSNNLQGADGCVSLSKYAQVATIVGCETIEGCTGAKERLRVSRRFSGGKVTFNQRKRQTFEFLPADSLLKLFLSAARPDT